MENRSRCEENHQSLICDRIKILSIQWERSIRVTTLWLGVGMSVNGIQHTIGSHTSDIGCMNGSISVIMMGNKDGGYCKYRHSLQGDGRRLRLCLLLVSQSVLAQKKRVISFP